MQTNLYIPKKIRVGFQKRGDTFTGKLGFITYIDDKGVLRQEKSWEGWRDKKIPFQEFDNVPRSNFVLNKDVQRYGHWSSNSKVRVHDSRDFEFEIELSNMMYILMHSDVSKRDIQEECVFGWSGKNIVLVPVNSEEYQKSVEHTRKQEVEFSLKNLVLGHTYSTKTNGNYVYLGYFEWCEESYSPVGSGKRFVNTGKKHIFRNEQKNSWRGVYVPLTAKELCECVSNEIHPEYSNYIESMMKTPHMKKLGKFSIKKGFDKIGYKKTTYEEIEVTLKDGPKADFEITIVEFKVENDKPKIIRQRKDRNSYYDNASRKKRHYIEKMRENNINPEKYDLLKKFFENAGFGVMYYTSPEGKKEIVEG